jgi:hypothetical protein
LVCATAPRQGLEDSVAISMDLLVGLVSFFLTILIFSYLIGDNPLFRIAIYIFTGVSAGYIAAVAWWQVILPKLVIPLLSAPTLQEKLFLLVPMLGAVLILMKLAPRLAGLARPVMAFLVGVGAAVTIAGALSGTLIPQVTGAINAFDRNAALARGSNVFDVTLNGGIILAGTVLTLIYFHFGARARADGSMHRFGVIELLAWVGRIFIAITLGAVFAGVYAAALTALIERISSLINFLGKLM